MKMRFTDSFSRSRLLIIASLFLFSLIAILPQKVAQAYYGGGLYGSSLYGGLYGIGNLSGSGSALGSVYYSGGGFGGLGGSMYGGLYGSSLYGGLYGSMYGGLYGSSMYGGLYGSSLYGGMYGGLYGSSLYGGLYGSSMYGGLYGSSMYGGMYGGGLGLYGGLYGGLGLSRYGLAEQVGSWAGTWNNITTKGAVVVASGPITINLVQDPVLPNTVAGYVQVVGNPFLGTIVDVTGQIINSQVILTGTGISAKGKSIVLDVVCTLTTPTDMFGDFTMTQSSTIVSTGSFTAALAPAVI